MRTASGVHTAVYRASGGRVAGEAGNLPVLLLTTTGRRTGKQRTAPLLFVRDGDDLVVVASNGGMDWFPAWWLNLQQHSFAVIEIGRERQMSPPPTPIRSGGRGSGPSSPGPTPATSSTRHALPGRYRW